MIEKTVDENGTTITYQHVRKPWLTIESRKRHIPHSGRPGTWDHTTYFVLVNGHDVSEHQVLKDAKKYAEDHYADQ
jgi:uncharacterized protein YabE (DUF348 family)